MNIQEFLKAEKVETITVLKGDIKEGFMKQEEMNEEFVNTLNDEIEVILWNNMKEKIDFELFDKASGNHYKSMLGHGNKIKFTDLYEILKRLYVYHHENQIFTLKFEEYEIEIDFQLLEKYNNFGRMILDNIGTDWKLKVSDFE